MLVIIIGKACSGKNAVVDELKKNGFRQIVTYTTRPKRNGEKDGREYHYITQEDFDKKRRSGFFAEVRDYHVNGKTWWYGSPLVEMLDSAIDDKKHVVILTPKAISSISTIKNISKNNVTVIYIYANQKTILKRLKKRQDKNDDIKRRMDADNLDFQYATTIADYIVYNNDTDNIKDVVDKIIYICEKNTT